MSNSRAIFRLGYITTKWFSSEFYSPLFTQTHSDEKHHQHFGIPPHNTLTTYFELRITFVASNPECSCKHCFCVFQGDTGIQGVQGSKGQKVIIDTHAFHFLLTHFHYHMVLVSHNTTALFPQGAKGVKGPKGRVRPSQRLFTF